MLAALLVGLALAGPRPPQHPLLGSDLAEALALRHKAPARFATWASLRDPLADEDAVVVVLELAPSADRAATVAGLQAAGHAVQQQQGAWLQVRSPWAALSELGRWPGVRRVRTPHRAQASGRPDGGAVRTEGLGDIFRDGSWHEAGHTGRGLRVAVVDVGFSGHDTLQGTELPEGLDTHLAEGGIDTPHGAAVAEVVHDLAPEAELLLVAFLTDVEFLAAVGAVSEAEVDVVNASIGFDNIWHADGTSPWTVAVDTLVAAQGLVWVAAAGNENERYRSGPLTDLDGDGVVELAGEEGAWLRTRGGTLRAVLRWSEPMRSATVDLDLVARTEDGHTCGSSTDPQDGAGTAPVESLLADCEDGRVWVSAVLADGAELPPGLDGYLYGADGVERAWRTEGGYLTLPGDTRAGLSVGACDRGTGAVPGYASRGPTEDGRLKPDLCAPTDVSTASLGDEAFAGSSAAAPHAAGLATLVVGGFGATTPSEALGVLRGRAVDLGDTGLDSAVGHGALNAGPPPPRCGCRATAPARSPALPLLALLPLVVGWRRRATAEPPRC